MPKTKAFIGTDMEGISGTCEWDHVDDDCLVYSQFTQIMTDELKAICATIGNNAGITIRDGHASAKNVIASQMPNNVNMIQYWNTNPLNMMLGLDDSFSFAMLHGYHSAGGSNLSPLAHTFSNDNFVSFKLNDKLAGEGTFALYTAAYFDVPMIYIVGDSGFVAEIKKLSPKTVGTITKDFPKQKLLSPEQVLKNIKNDCKKAVIGFNKNPNMCKIKLPKSFKLEITYVDSRQAKLHAQKIPNIELLNSTTVGYETNDYLDLLTVMRLLKLKIHRQNIFLKIYRKLIK
ncbi:MAG: M55 family metallopeptidase [Rickettsiales bacterium]|jgi:D-amino peptidase|nr:M55 family metallopeptidase [Rickettsiales bacterium]